MAERGRGERVIVGYNRNAPPKTVFGAWSVRARLGTQVSRTFHWGELPGIYRDDLTLGTLLIGSRRIPTRKPR